MMSFPSTHRVYLAVGAIDMRKAINGLSILVQAKLKLDPFGAQYVAFCNRRRTLVKILYWDRTGYCLWQKRLEKKRFRWPTRAGDVAELDGRQMEWLLAGLDVGQAHEELKYSTVV
jgi:transposase